MCTKTPIKLVYHAAPPNHAVLRVTRMWLINRTLISMNGQVRLVEQVFKIDTFAKSAPGSFNVFASKPL